MRKYLVPMMLLCTMMATWTAAQAAEPGPLQLTRIETLVVNCLTPKPIAMLHHTVGIGRVSENGNGEKFTATVTDYLPAGATLLSPKGNSWAAQSADREPYTVEANMYSAAQGVAVDLSFVDAPCVPPQKTSASCGCGGASSGGARSVLVNHSSSLPPGTDPFTWSRVLFKISGQPLTVGQKGKVSVEVFAHVLQGEPGRFTIWIPANADGASIEVLGVTDGAATKRLQNGTRVTLQSPADNGYLKAFLSVLPSKAGEVDLGGLMQVQVSQPKPLAAEPTVTGGAETKTTCSSSVLYQKPIVVQVATQASQAKAKTTAGGALTAKRPQVRKAKVVAVKNRPVMPTAAKPPAPKRSEGGCGGCGG